MIGRTTAGLGLVLALLWAGAAEARTFEVNKLGDPVPGACTPRHCTLREAILRANNQSAGPDKVVLPSRRGRYRLTQPNVDPAVGEDGGQTGDLDVTNGPLTIVHPARGLATIDANQIDRVLTAFSPLTLKRIKLTGGDTTAYDMTPDEGGGVRTFARLRVIRSMITANFADHGGGINATTGSRLYVIRSAITNNEDFDGGGGIQLSDALPSKIVRSKIVRNREINQLGSEAAGIQVFSTDLAISRSTIASNVALREGGGMSIINGSRVRIKDSTISGNRAEQVDVEPAHGGGIYVSGSELKLTNSTVHGNSSDGAGGGIYNTTGGQVSLNAVTIARNTAQAEDAGKPVANGGGFYQGGDAFRVRNSIVALNEVGALGVRNDCNFALTPPTSLGHNLISDDGTCEGFNAPGDMVRSNPRLGKLKRNGGPTKTVALKRRSPAIGKAHGPSAPNRDQRGRKRDRRPDIGAFER